MWAMSIFIDNTTEDDLPDYYELIIEDYELPRHTLFVSNKINILDFHKINNNNIEEILLYYKKIGQSSLKLF